MWKWLGVIALISVLVALPEVSKAQTLQAAMSAPTNAPVVTLAAFPTDLQSAQNMPASQVVAIIGGGVIGAALADMVLDGGLFTVVGAIVGAIGGNTWHARHYWPFQ